MSSCAGTADQPRMEALEKMLQSMTVAPTSPAVQQDRLRSVSSPAEAKEALSAL